MKWATVFSSTPGAYDKWKHCMVGCNVSRDSSCGGNNVAKYLAWQNECMDASDCNESLSEQGDVDATIDGGNVPEGTSCEDYCNDKYPHPTQQPESSYLLNEPIILIYPYPK